VRLYGFARQRALHAGQGVIAGHGEYPVHLPHLEPAQIRNAAGFVGGADDERGTSIAQCLPGAAQHLGGEAQVDAGLQAVELPNQGRDQFKVEDFIADDPQPVFPAAGDLFDALRDAARFLHHARRLVGQQAARRGEFKAIMAAVEEQRVEAFFKLPRGVGDGGRRFAQFDCGARQAAAFADGFDQCQFVFR
jgi:hypothetical protein